jgi:hypothetical protein
MPLNGELSKAPFELFTGHFDAVSASFHQSRSTSRARDCITMPPLPERFVLDQLLVTLRHSGLEVIIDSPDTGD